MLLLSEAHIIHCCINPCVHLCVVAAEIDQPSSSSSGHHANGAGSSHSRRQLCGGTQAAVEKMLAFGRDLHSMSEHLKHEYGTNETNKNTLRVNRLIYL